MEVLVLVLIVDCKKSLAMLCNLLDLCFALPQSAFFLLLDGGTAGTASFLSRLEVEALLGRVGLGERPFEEGTCVIGCCSLACGLLLLLARVKLGLEEVRTGDFRMARLLVIDCGPLV